MYGFKSLVYVDSECVQRVFSSSTIESIDTKADLDSYPRSLEYKRCKQSKHGAQCKHLIPREDHLGLVSRSRFTLQTC